jgi:hypothetical protein
MAWVNAAESKSDKAIEFATSAWAGLLDISRTFPSNGAQPERKEAKL